MKIEAPAQVWLFSWSGGRVEPVKPDQDAFVQPGIDLRRLTGLPSFGKTFMPDPPRIIFSNVSIPLTRVNC